MCGIAGIYNFASSQRVEEKLLRKMCAVLAHRGPDDEGVYCKNNIGLGHKRLSIIDLEGGAQPMSNEDGSIWIVFNGEIYNFREIRAGLIEKGHIFRTKCDTEVILHLYEEEKEGCLEELNGMFAFAIWDEKRQILFLARDRLGIKPLHYIARAGRLIFASEIKAILQDEAVNNNIDYQALSDYLTFSYIPSPKTIFEDIKKLSAGHYLICGKEKFEIRQYWDIDFSKAIRQTEGQIRENIYERLKKSVQIQLVSDVTLGAFLSGGIDSSSIVSLMSQIQDKPVITNSIGFSDKNYDELKFARILSDRYSTEHHEYLVRPQAEEVLDKLLWFYDEPFGDASAIPTYYVSKMARQNVKVALSGDGGDENFAGYTKYTYSNEIVNLQKIFPSFAKNIIKNISCSSTAGEMTAWSMKLNNKLKEFYLSPFDVYFKIISIFKEEEKTRLFSEKLKNKIRDYTPKEQYKNIFANCQSPDYISKLQYLDIKTSLSDCMLTKVDRASMANSLEVRVPFLDHTFMEYVASIPAHFQYKGLSGKYILKKTMARDLPVQILNRPKMGFEVPLAFWFKNELRSTAEKELFSEGGIIPELFNEQYIKKIWSFLLNDRLKGFSEKDFSQRIWLLLVLSRWFKKYA